MVDSIRKYPRTFTAAVAPVLRLMPPWWKARLYGRIEGPGLGEKGQSGEVRRKRIGPHQYEMELYLDDPMERFAYVCGCYWGLDVTATVQKLLHQGDHFIDVGANLGFLTLCASRVVGASGKVLAFEPFADMAERLRRALTENKIGNVTVYEHALGETCTEATLDLDDHSSKANLRTADAHGPRIRVLRGDDVIGTLPTDAWVLAKLDVEGYELRVLKGFEGLVKRRKTAFLVEVTDSWLTKMGGSAAELFALMTNSGYSSYIPRLTALSQLELIPIKAPNPSKTHYDVVFLRSNDHWLVRN
jgi:FkbM family methyltransferase